MRAWLLLSILEVTQDAWRSFLTSFAVRNVNQNGRDSQRLLSSGCVKCLDDLSFSKVIINVQVSLAGIKNCHTQFGCVL